MLVFLDFQTWVSPIDLDQISPLPCVYFSCFWYAAGGNFPASRLEQHQLREFQELERKIMHKVLDDYIPLCHQVAVCIFFINSCRYLNSDFSANTDCLRFVRNDARFSLVMTFLRAPLFSVVDRAELLKHVKLCFGISLKK